MQQFFQTIMYILKSTSLHDAKKPKPKQNMEMNLKSDSGIFSEKDRNICIII